MFLDAWYRSAMKSGTDIPLSIALARDFLKVGTYIFTILGLAFVYRRVIGHALAIESHEVAMTRNEPTGS
jgi:hypothetical protein